MANKIYKIDETTQVFGSEVGDDVAFSCDADSGLQNGAARYSAQLDLGAGTTARAKHYMWRFWTQLQATPTVGAVLRIYLSTEDNSSAHPLNDEGTTDAEKTAEDKLRNLHLLGYCVVDEAAASVEFVAEGECVINARYVQVVVWNASGATTSTTESHTKFALTPIPFEVQ